jgi:hypothetical protein
MCNYINAQGDIVVSGESMECQRKGDHPFNEQSVGSGVVRDSLT